MKVTEQTKMLVTGLKERQATLRDKMELVILRDLVDKLDPGHDYFFDARTMEFTKTQKKQLGEVDES
jgi:hypothetical protein